MRSYGPRLLPCAGCRAGDARLYAREEDGPLGLRHGDEDQAERWRQGVRPGRSAHCKRLLANGHDPAYRTATWALRPLPAAGLTVFSPRNWVLCFVIGVAFSGQGLHAGQGGISLANAAPCLSYTARNRHAQEDGSSRMHGSSWLYEDKAQPSWSDWHEAIGDSLLHLSVRGFCAHAVLRQNTM